MFSSLPLNALGRLCARALPLPDHIFYRDSPGTRLLTRYLPFGGTAEPFAGNRTGFLSFTKIPTERLVKFYAESPALRTYPHHPRRAGSGSRRLEFQHRPAFSFLSACPSDLQFFNLE